MPLMKMSASAKQMNYPFLFSGTKISRSPKDDERCGIGQMKISRSPKDDGRCGIGQMKISRSPKDGERCGIGE